MVRILGVHTVKALDKTGHKNTLVRGHAGGNCSLARPQKSVARDVGLSDLIIPGHNFMASRTRFSHLMKNEFIS